MIPTFYQFLIIFSSTGINPCNLTTNGGCSDLCLLNTRGHSCACPTGVKLLPDQTTCEQGILDHLNLSQFLVNLF